MHEQVEGRKAESFSDRAAGPMATPLRDTSPRHAAHRVSCRGGEIVPPGSWLSPHRGTWRVNRLPEALAISKKLRAEAHCGADMA